MNRYLLLLSICCCLMRMQAQESKVIDKVVGVVGEHPVLLSEVEMQFQQFLASGEDIGDIRCDIFDQLMLERLFLKQAEMDSIVVSQDEVDGELDRRIRYFTSMFGTLEKLEEYYGKSIIELKDEFEEDIYKQLLADRLRGQIFSNITVTPSEVKEFFKTIPEDSLPFFNAEVELAQILVFPQVAKAQKDYARERIEGLRQELLDGADFCLKSLLYSDDPGSKENCGELGFIRRGEMVPEFEAAAFRLNEGEISGPVESEFGFHLIKCIQKKGERVHVRHILVSPKITKVEMGEAEALIDSVSKLLMDGSMSWKDAVPAFSQDENTAKNEGLLINPQTGTSTFNMDEMEPELAFLIENLEVGAISRPGAYVNETGKQGLRIVKLMSEIEPHQANLKQDYAKIQIAAKQSKQQEMLEKWIKEKSGQTHIFVDALYAGCPTVGKWSADK